MTRVEAALAECDRLIAGYEVAPGGHMAFALLRIGRDVLTRHTPAIDADGDPVRVYRCRCGHPWPCPDAKPWLDFLAPEADT